MDGLDMLHEQCETSPCLYCRTLNKNRSNFMIFKNAQKVGDMKGYKPLLKNEMELTFKHWTYKPKRCERFIKIEWIQDYI